MASCLVEEERTFTLESYGKDKTEAFSKAFSDLKNKAYAALQGEALLLYMEPLEVEIISEHMQDTREKITSFFRPKPIMYYQVKFEVTVKLRYVPIKSGE